MTDRRTNLNLLYTVANALGDFVSEVVFVGGSVVELLLTDKGMTDIRPTDDVDLIVEVLAYKDYQQVLRNLEKRGFCHNMIDPGPICRLEVEGISVDVMPVLGDFLGFKNDWYKIAMETAELVSIGNELEIRVVNAPAFICTKLEAFKDRGKGDYLMSHDIEDVVTLINGRQELEAECWSMPVEARNYLRTSFGKLKSDSDFLSALPGMLSFESQTRENIVKRLITRLSNIPEDEFFSGHVEVKFGGSPFEIAIISMNNFSNNASFPTKEIHSKDELFTCLEALGIRNYKDLVETEVSRLYPIENLEFVNLAHWQLIPSLNQ